MADCGMTVDTAYSKVEEVVRSVMTENLKLKNQSEALKRDLELRERESEENSRLIQELQTERDHLQQVNEDEAIHREHVQVLLQTGEQKLSVCKAMIQSMQNAIVEIRGRCEFYESWQTTVMDTMTRMDAELDSSELKLKTATEELEGLRNAKKMCEQENKILSQEKKDALSQVAKKEALIEEQKVSFENELDKVREQLTDEVTDWKTKYEQMHQEVIEWKTKYEQVHQDVAEWKTKHDQMRHEIVDWKEKSEQMHLEEMRLKEDLHNSRKLQSDMDAMISNLKGVEKDQKEKITALQEQVKKMETEMAAKNILHSQALKELKSRETQLAAEVSSFQAEVSTIRRGKISAEDENERLKFKLHQLEKEMEACTAELSAKDRAFDEYSVEVRNLQEQILILESEVSVQKNQLETHIQSEKHKDDLIDTLKIELESLRITYEDLKANNVSLLLDCQNLRIKESVIDGLNAEINSLSMSISQFEADKLERDKEISCLKETILNNESEKSNLVANLVAQVNMLQDAASSYEQSNSKLAADAATLKEIVAQYESEKSILTGENTLLKELTARLESEKSVLSVEGSSKEKQIEDLEAQIVAIKKQVENLEVENSVILAEKTNLEQGSLDIEEKLAASEARRLAELSAKDQELEEMRDAAEAEKSRLESSLAAYERSSTELTALMKARAEEHKTMEIQLTQTLRKLESEFDSTKNQLDNAMAAHKQEISLLRIANSELETKLQEERSNNEKLRSCVNDERTQIILLTAEIESSRKEAERLRLQLEQDQKALLCLKTDIEERQHCFDSTLKSKNEELQAAENAGLSSAKQIQNLEAELTEAREKIEILMKKEKDLETDIAALLAKGSVTMSPSCNKPATQVEMYKAFNAKTDQSSSRSQQTKFQPYARVSNPSLAVPVNKTNPGFASARVVKKHLEPLSPIRRAASCRNVFESDSSFDFSLSPKKKTDIASAGGVALEKKGDAAKELINRKVYKSRRK